MAGSGPSGELNSVFGSIRIGSLPRVKEVITIPASMKIKDAVELLYSKRILSAPVIDEDAKDDAPWSERYVGLLDMMKVVVLALTSLETPTAIAEEDETQEEPSTPVDLPPLPSAFALRTVGSLTKDDSGWLPFMPLESDSSLLDAILLLGQYRLKRLPIIEDNKVVNIVSQTTVVKLLAERLGDFGSVASKTLEELGLAEPKEVLAVRADQPVKEAFDIIRRHNVSAVPVIGVDGGMVGNISARHGFFIVMATNKYLWLNISVKEFLARVSQRESGYNIRSSSVLAKPSDTLGEVIQKMDQLHVHRLYVSDERRRVFRVVAMCDVLEQFAKAEDTSCAVV